MNRFSLVRGLIAAVFLSGCSVGADAPSTELQIFDAVGEAITSKSVAKKPRVVVTRATLDTLDGAFIEVTLERNDQLAYLFIDAVRRDDQPGKITIWRTYDNVTLAMRNGMLIAVRGLGGGIVSSTVLARGNTLGPAYDGEHVQYIQGLDNKQVRLSMVCDVVQIGPETIEIVEHRHATRHVQERCQGGGGTVVNDFWIDSRAGFVRQSRQWAGPEIGYLRIRRLKN